MKHPNNEPCPNCQTPFDGDDCDECGHDANDALCPCAYCMDERWRAEMWPDGYDDKGEHE